jgi:hypothetical protein
MHGTASFTSKIVGTTFSSICRIDPSAQPSAGAAREALGPARTRECSYAKTTPTWHSK